MAKVCTNSLRNGRFGTEIVLEPPIESDAETESNDEEQASENEPISGDSESERETNENLEDISTKRTFKWGKSNVLAANITFRSKFRNVDDEIHLPISYFRQIFDQNISEAIAEQTNTYSVQKQQKSVATTCDEIDRYLGVLLRMAIIPMPRYRMYWEKDTVRH